MGPKILTVDDSKLIRNSMIRNFRKYACELLEAEDGAEGLAIARRERPDLILCDVKMPGMDGVEMLSKLKADPELRGIPVIMLTGEADRESVVRIAKLGVRDYLVKPFNAEGIVERVQRVIPLKPRSELVARAKRLDDPVQILVVENKPAIVQQIQAALTGTTWVIHSAEEVQQALDMCLRALPDLVLVSLSLPENAGFNLPQLFRGHPRTQGIPLLALCVRTDTEEQAQAQQLGFNSIVTKPISRADLQSKVVRTLGLDTSYRYFQRQENVMVLTLPATVDAAVVKEISPHLRGKLRDAVDAGSNHLVVDLSQLEAADVTLVKLLLEIIQLCSELQIWHCLVGSEVVRRECKNYEETKTWKLINSLPEALAILSEKLSVPG